MIRDLLHMHGSNVARRPPRLLRHQAQLWKARRGSQRFLARSSRQPSRSNGDLQSYIVLQSSQHASKVSHRSMAVRRVLEITELLESILLHLSIREILAVKPVSRQWRGLIERSILIRRKTFHSPDRRIMRRNHEPLSDHLSTVMSLRDIPTLQGNNFDPMPLFNSWDLTDDRCQRKPWIYQIKSTYMTDKQLHTFHWGNDAEFGFLSPAMRSMFITQPPVTTIFLFIQHRGFGTLSPCVTLHMPDGLTLGAALDTLTKMHEQVQPEWESMCRTFVPVYGGFFLTSLSD